jgi:Sec-independent protein translocase protein TatA
MGASELGVVAFLLLVLFGANKLSGKKKSSSKTAGSKTNEGIADSTKNSKKKEQITHRSA